ncbi:acyl-CoA dehydrogenase family protein [Orrella sp. 11846]|uniref:acyl-CoA dehydrogenase family protein n=1 Tax=Orrella sp. 11846 TaxID=3409913 RepID=UPI003B5CBFD2
MNIDLNPEQIVLKDAIKDFLDGEGFDIQSAVQGLSPEKLDALWAQCAQMGWFRSRLTEAQQGLALSTQDVAVLHEEMGKHLLSIPVAHAVAVQTYLDPAHDILKDWLSGDRRLGIAQATSNHPGSFLVDYASADHQAVHLSWSDATLIVTQFTGVEPSFGIDPLIATSLIAPDAAVTNTFNASVSQTAWSEYQILRDLLRMAELIGVGAQAMELGTQYACEREQFNKPIGAYQAIKHKLADDWMRLDNARLCLHEACRLFDLAKTDADKVRLPFALEAARLLVPEAAQLAASHAIQIHGAMGITWECPVHLCLKRVRHMVSTDTRLRHPSQTLDALWHASATTTHE